MRATEDVLIITMAKESKRERERAVHGTVVDASSAASGGRPDAVRGFDHVDLWQASGLEERASEIAEDAKFVRKCARGHAKDCSHKSMSRWRSASSKVPTPSGVKDGAPCKRLGRV